MKLCLLVSDSRYTYTVHVRGYSVVADLFPVRERGLYEHAVSYFTVLLYHKCGCYLCVY